MGEVVPFKRRGVVVPVRRLPDTPRPSLFAAILILLGLVLIGRSKQ